MFLGKYGGINNDTVNLDNILIARLKNKLSLELPYENTTFKINLQGVLQAALEQEDVDACKTLCVVICANLATRQDATLQSVLIRVLVTLSRADGACAVGAVGAAQELLAYILKEKSHRSRKILLEALESLLKSEADDLLLQNVVESVIYYEDLKFNRQAILDVIEKLLQLLRDNNLLCKKYIPEILVKVIKSEDTNLIKIVTDIFKDKIELYDDDVLKYTTDNVFVVLNSKNKMADAAIKMAVMFAKDIYERKNDLSIVDYYLTVKGVRLAVLVAFKQVSDFDGVCAKVLIGKLKDGLFACGHFDEDDGIFDFVAEYMDVLIEVECSNTYNLLSRLIKKLTPELIVSKNIALSKCLSLLKRKGNQETIAIERSLENVTKTLPIKDITESIEKYSFEAKHEIYLNALNILTDLFMDGPILMEFSRYIKSWLGWIVKLNSTGYIDRCLKSKMAYLIDLVAVSLKFSNDDEIISLVLKGDEKTGVKFLSDFMPATFKYLVQKPYALLTAGMEECCSLLNDVVMYAVRRNRGGEVVEAVDVLWLTYAPISTFDQKYSMLLCLATKLPPSSNPMQWVVATVEGGSLVEKIKLVMLLDDENIIRGALAPPLRPPRAPLALRAALDALARTRARPLLGLVATLAEGDNTKGWWDDAYDMCMSTLATQADMCMLQYVYSRTFHGRGEGICDRLMVPLLRYVKPSVCEEFVSSILSELLSLLRVTPRAITNHYSYGKCVMDYVRVFKVILVVFERVPKENIESPRSMLYSKMSEAVGDTPFYLISTVCKLCFTLRTKVTCPEGADEAMEKSCRSFQCANYNCLVTAIVLRDPKPQVYETVLDESVWARLVGDEDIDLPIREQWRQRVTRQAVPAALSELRTRTLSDARTRTRMFTRTLSENPLAYDLLQEHDEMGPQELEVSDNPLNRHPCAATLSSLFSAVGSRGIDVWGGLERALAEGPPRVAWLLAQAVVNSREQLQARAHVLQRALLALVARSAHNRTLNALHVDILDTLILWRVNATENADLAIEYIINTAINNRHRTNVYWMLVDKLAKLLDIWKDARPNWTSFEKYFTDPKADMVKVCLQILKRITKCGVHIPQLLPALMAAMEARRCTIETFEVFGLVLSIDDSRDLYIKRYLKVLEKLRKSDVAEYIKCLYYVQKGYPACCDESNFRSITDLTPKILGREKLKCLEVLSTCALTVRRTDHVVAMFETVGLGENLHTIEGLKLVRNGLHLMDEHRRRHYVLQVAGTSRQMTAKLRQVAFEILVKALELLMSLEHTEPPSKRSARASNSLILSEKDGYTRALLEGLARGVMEGSEEIRRTVRQGVGDLLDKDLAVRFCESFYLAVLLPHTDVSINPAAILDMFFHILRDEKLKNTKLRDEPIQPRVTTMAASDILKGEEDSSEEGNLQMSLDDILDSLLKFSQRNINAATSLVVQLVKVNQTKRPGFDFAATLGAAALPALGAPWGGEVARAGQLWDCDGLKPAIEKLLKLTKYTEEESVSKLLDEDYKIRCLGPEQFVLGSRGDDVITPPASNKFSMQDLISAFGQLSNWDNLTIRQKSRIKSSLPPMWTSRENFGMSLRDLDVKDCPVWMKCMVSACNGDFDDHYQYLKDVDKRPRRLFDVSAVTETSIWKSIRDGVDMKSIYIPNNIRPSDCLAEWAVRIMIRSSFLQSEQCDPARMSLSRSHALRWCACAVECGLPAHALRCCKDITDLYESETLKWFRQRVLALRAIALEENDFERLRSALNLAESFTPQFVDKSSFVDVVGMSEAMLLLRNDLKSLNKDHIQSALEGINKDVLENSSDKMADRKVLASVCVLALKFYDQLWETIKGKSV
ncbi:uncharacterized protein LOC124541516 [Vanessa cardui]|uniref:uncharacterized protein LOC124541516 n=1 Tax=Vanessa cardui TaxID=171605 RepID=UPI001F1393F2|nr:uncharacterized protein LOC124541516 [Vanessa cardui]